MRLFRVFFLIILLIRVGTGYALSQSEVEMADTMRAEGKIYVIVGIILIVLAGLFVYLFMLDRKVSKLEDKVK
ncbi:MAG: CcmD family protein [Flammeovirgaceae bacterium]|nr:MAG: CcmD family protein [Flammeovirgaceae bacterium]